MFPNEGMMVMGKWKTQKGEKKKITFGFVTDLLLSPWARWEAGASIPCVGPGQGGGGGILAEGRKEGTSKWTNEYVWITEGVWGSSWPFLVWLFSFPGRGRHSHLLHTPADAPARDGKWREEVRKGSLLCTGHLRMCYFTHISKLGKLEPCLVFLKNWQPRKLFYSNICHKCYLVKM